MSRVRFNIETLRRRRRVFILLFLIAALAVLLKAVSSPPQNDRQWDIAFSRAPLFEAVGDDKWRLHDLRAFTFDHDGRQNPAWETTDIDPAALTEIWFFIEPFEAWSGVAHTLLSFVFDGDNPQTLSISVEARREANETYSGLRGLFSAYELINIWSTEKDVLTRIAVGLDHNIYAYRLNVTPEQAQAILQHFIRRTNDLYHSPRYYNTLTSNCTNELAKAVNDAFPGALPPHYAHWLTGYSGQRLHELGFLGKTEEPFSKLGNSANAQKSIKAAYQMSAHSFPHAWRSQFTSGSEQNQ